MTLNDLLEKQGLDPAQVIAMRHRPKEKELRKVLPWLVHERPAVFNAYQQSHGGHQEQALEKLVGSGFLASFVGLRAGTAVFAGLYQIRAARPVGYREFWDMHANQALKSFGLPDWDKKYRRKTCLWFDLELLPAYAQWTGKLEVEWPAPAIKWWRHAHTKEMPVLSISEDSRFSEQMPDWQDLVLTWAELQAIPSKWKDALRQWRGIYFIHDDSDGKGYVGAAYGKDNLLGRWLNYASSGHGGDKLLVARHPGNFHFGILQRVSPDMPADEVIRVESSWKDRLHTRGEFGLNQN